MAKANYVRVIVDRAINRELDYAVPESLSDRIGIGSRVRVPFREKSALATVVAVPEQSEAKGIRSIEAIIGDAPALSERRTCSARRRWITRRYERWQSAVLFSYASDQSCAIRTETNNSSQV